MHPITESPMLEACAQVHHDNDSSFNGKIKVGPFPWKVETAIKFLTLLTDMESERDFLKSFIQTPLSQLELSSRSHVSFMLSLWDKRSLMGKWSISIQLTLMVLHLHVVLETT
jgi:hypothetical protein